MRVDRKGSPRTEAWDHPAFRDKYVSSVSQAVGTQTFQTHRVHLEHYALTYIHPFNLTHKIISQKPFCPPGTTYISQKIFL